LLECWFPSLVLVLEGAARAALDNLPEAGRVRVVAAAGSGDDLIADLAAQLPGQRLVVTADRELRGRCIAAGAAVTGPRWLLGML
jgi:rRNA-processing protein FCF1